jgi:TrmH family RNA methyltransferase
MRAGMVFTSAAGVYHRAAMALLTPTLARRIRALRRDRPAREAEGVFLAEGLHLAEEALRAGATIELAVVSPRLLHSAQGEALRRALDQVGAPVAETGDDALDRLQDVRAPQPVLLLIRRSAPRLDAVLAGRGGPMLLVVAAGVQDPGNLGALVRTADAAGATGFVAVGEGCDLHHPRAVRGTMGGVFRLPMVALEGEDGDEALLHALRPRGATLVGATPEAGTPYHRVDLTGPVALVFGGEGRGLRGPLAAVLDVRARIPMHPGVDSLSVAAAAAVLTFEAARQRGRVPASGSDG